MQRLTQLHDAGCCNARLVDGRDELAPGLLKQRHLMPRLQVQVTHDGHRKGWCIAASGDVAGGG